jgi:small neutral amino acid transporter SnatA (MarC family)
VNEPWLALFAAINPAAALIAFRGAVADRWATSAFAAQRLLVVAVGIAVALALYAGLALWGDDLLDSLNIAPETFRIAAGIVMAASGVFAIWRIGLADDGALPGLGAGVFPLGIPLLASAAGLVAALSYGVDQYSARTFLAATVIVTVTGALPGSIATHGALSPGLSPASPAPCSSPSPPPRGRRHATLTRG